ncbi:probable receptor-like serine/threonine-protein kinase At5g57670 isoform X2 [Andrographis paniculata]|uniref:probable receptor-like serine/threonine-protein kinase At5g57670 isoform X2 n=1 Tax=Andrographis paniculata TaxID=175694 RepID=UPI0021E6F554|nr:probable receptor-like serine/threonine-protein kinase At5g57670 isoform X2 [Andrographis paniculata]
MLLSKLPAKILVGISSDAAESHDLISWAIRVVARPGDTVVAFHVIGATPENKSIESRKENKIKKESSRKIQKQIRQAKSYAISITGELVKTSQSHEVNLEARIGINSSTGKCLVLEATAMAADYLVIGGHRRNRTTSSVSKYCCEHVPKDCSLVIVRRTRQDHFSDTSLLLQDCPDESSNRWSEKNSDVESSFSSDENEISTSMKCKKPSPRTVLSICEEDSQSNTDEDSSNSSESLATFSTLVTEDKQESRKPISPFKIISSFFRLPSFDGSARKQEKDLLKNQKDQPLLECFSYQQLAIATRNFCIENMVGQGGYSEVYKGETAKGCSIAVKRLAKDNANPEKEKEFLMELGIIGQVNHPNTAKLLGFCVENGLYLVFELYPYGTLSSALHEATRPYLDWPIRYRIILGVARGLHYLHKCCKHRIIHRDIKASNVLLGPDYEPQISDFGLAKWLPSKWTHHAVIPIEGTFGYLAPEYFMHGIVDEKTDVFAFGILLLEIITGRRPVDSTGQHLLLWAKPLMESGNLKELADPKMEGRFEMEDFYRVALTASYCVRQSSIWRPSMTEVLQLLRYGQGLELSESWRIPKFTSDEIDDYSMVFGYELPSDLALDDILFMQ